MEEEIIEQKMGGQNQWSEAELALLLQNATIKATDKFDVPPEILWVGDSTIATFGNFSASTGKAKSRKTFNVSAIVAASLVNGNILRYRACLPAKQRKILYFDTEQSRYHCHNVLTRILKLANLPIDKDPQNMKFIGLREYSPTLRLQLIDYALKTSKGYGLVVIDGIRDLMYDINSARESIDLITKMMAWSSRYNLHIHCVLHLNKGDDNTRGHIGTELNNKAESVLVISNSKTNKSVSELKPMHMRSKEFDPFAITINSEGLPVLVEQYNWEQPKAGTTIQDLPEEKHREALQIAFSDSEIPRYVDLINALIKGYSEIGFQRSRSCMTEVYKFLVSQGAIVKGHNGYQFNPDFEMGEQEDDK